MAKRETKVATENIPNEWVRDISEAVYRDRLGADDTARMIAKDGDTGQKLRNRAGGYDSLTRTYIAALGAKPPSK